MVTVAASAGFAGMTAPAAVVVVVLPEPERYRKRVRLGGLESVAGGVIAALAFRVAAGAGLAVMAAVAATPGAGPSAAGIVVGFPDPKK